MDHEDLTNIKDPKEKKRLQNRIAQRTHREKLKSRIRELERALEGKQNKSPPQQNVSQPIPPYSESIGLHSLPTSLAMTNASTEAVMVWNSKEMYPSEYLPPAEYGNTPVVAEDPVSPAYGTSSTVKPLIAHFEPLGEEASLNETTELRTRSVTGDRGWPLSDLDDQDVRPATVQLRETSNPLRKEKNINLDIHQKSTSSLFQSDIDDLFQFIESSESSGSSSNGERIATTEVDPGFQNSNSCSCTRPGQDSSLTERLSHLMECSKQLGFDNLENALLCYYTSDVRDSALLSHKQSLSRARKLSHFLSVLRENSKAWSNWERADFIREIVQSAEEIYVDECMVARKHQVDLNIGDFGKDFASVEHVSQKLQCEAPNTWALVSSIMLPLTSPGQVHLPQTLLVLMLLLDCPSRDLGNVFRLSRAHCPQQNDEADDRANGYRRA